ncbi:MAG: rod shape-determining protein [Eubacterium sp.]|nr:rod shape-determining protein [Eubacterium sp.]
MAAVTDIGIDLGTASIIVYAKGRGIVMKEPSLVAFDRDANKIVAFGSEAEQLLDNPHGNLMAIRPLKEGVISSYIITEKMLQYYIRRAIGHRYLLKPRIVVCIPSGVTEVERRAVEQASYQAGARDVFIVREPVAAAMGAGIDVMRASGSLIVNVGGGITEIAVISMADLVVSQTLKEGGDSFDEAIIRYARDIYGLYIDKTTAEKIKKTVGSVAESDEDGNGQPLERIEVQGRDIDAGFPRRVSFTQAQVREALSDPFRRIVDGIRSVIERTPPDLTGDIAERGIVLTGGGAMVSGLRKAVQKSTGIRTILAENPETACAEGTGLYIANMASLEPARAGFFRR